MLTKEVLKNVKGGNIIKTQGQYGNFPNEEFFWRRLRQEDDESAMSLREQENHLFRNQVPASRIIQVRKHIHYPPFIHSAHKDTKRPIKVSHSILSGIQSSRFLLIVPG